MSQSLPPPFRSLKGEMEVGESGGLVERAREVKDVQTAEVEAASMTAEYGASFAAQLQAKQQQVARLEDRLEAVLELQTSRLQSARTQQPGLLSRPGTRERWQRQVAQQQSAIQRLQGRLETVREIKEGMGLHSPRIEELAARKVQVHDPRLAEGWKEMQEAVRHQQALARMRESQKRKTADKLRRAPGGGLTLRLAANGDQ